eukprot:CAMPEP_0198734448 /NCGR_PEP_ID=MMETSP1475-20131203/52564_1 /TAXON_ID= ORGANISM="Unidentified sp., Strain CCMP1999" /NCGR_SAMPLE_ID=MMETSP1475 /ASSEMBLY_ACC=CAM_ASM_001111 /LENGTH=122 /DNA_ID=CAMNT_0044497921 /DNA_START=79 /DNA_END=447 /DNA_ORIENTATION=-
MSAQIGHLEISQRAQLTEELTLLLVKDLLVAPQSVFVLEGATTKTASALTNALMDGPLVRVEVHELTKASIALFANKHSFLLVHVVHVPPQVELARKCCVALRTGENIRALQLTVLRRVLTS